MITVKEKLQFSRGNAGKRRIKKKPRKPVELPVGRIPRISKLMALAVRYDRLLREGVVADQTELARPAKVTQPRMTQIMNLLYLAPDIQEELLFLPLVTSGKDPVTERDLRPLAAEVDWGRQRGVWRRLTDRGLCR